MLAFITRLLTFAIALFTWWRETEQKREAAEKIEAEKKKDADAKKQQADSIRNSDLPDDLILRPEDRNRG